MLSSDLSLLASSHAAELLLVEAADEYQRGQGELPGAVYGVVGGLLAAERGDPLTAAAPRARMRTAAGRWLTLHATWLRARELGLEPRIAVVLEASSPGRVWPLVTAARRLSPREGEVTLLVARGLSTAEIGRTLRIAENTVQDHLKAVFDKFGVRSRGQLLASIFSDHYLPPDRSLRR